MRLRTAWRRYAWSAPTRRGSKSLDPLKRPEQGVLDKVVGVGEIARPLGQAAAGPSLERLQMPREQLLERLLIAGAGAVDQLKVDSGSVRPDP